eukprot:5445364-Amphidinium_carterae.1
MGEAALPSTAGDPLKGQAWCLEHPKISRYRSRAWPLLFCCLAYGTSVFKARESSVCTKAV